MWRHIVTFIQFLWNELLIFIGLRYRSFRILVIGDNSIQSGKSSFIALLQGKEQYLLPPRQHTLVTTEHKVLLSGHSPPIILKCIDYTSQETARRLLQDYFDSVDGVIYMMDASNVSDLVKIDVYGILSAPELENKPLLILANKMDLVAIDKEVSLRNYLGLNGIRDKVMFCMCSVKEKVGFAKGMSWLHSNLVTRR